MAVARHLSAPPRGAPECIRFAARQQRQAKKPDGATFNAGVRPMLAEILDLLGKSKGASQVVAFIKTADARAFIRQNEDRWYCALRAIGVELLFDESGVLQAAFLHSAGHEGFQAFARELPQRLAFGMDQSAIRAYLG